MTATYPPMPGEGLERADKAKAEYVRIARALIGTTPAQLAAHIGARRDLPPAIAANEPALTPERLTAALRVVIGWYSDEPAAASSDSAAAARRDGALAETVHEDDLDALVRKYIVLRAEWEAREAIRASAEMGERARRVATARLGQAAAAMPVAAEAQPQAAAPPTRRRALLVDDASDVIVTVGAFLESFGFDVLRASNADLALQILADGTRIDLLVTDHAMPGMTGRDLTVQACQQRPNLHALIITGYPDAEELGSLPDGVLLLAKPFRRAELAACIKRLFEGRPAMPVEQAMPAVMRLA